MDERYREGVARLVQRGLVYDAWQYHPQLPELCSLADAFPQAEIVANHCGGLLGINAYAHDGNFVNWRALVTELARRPNVSMKLGGLGLRRCGFGFEQRQTPATAEEIADAWQPYIETCIELFGPSRCLFESNFPPNSSASSYRVMWNALKLTASRCTRAEREQMFSTTAKRIYRIQ
jgi:predicted TIM-barrel fold metal-dependent hydrolase